MYTFTYIGLQRVYDIYITACCTIDRQRVIPLLCIWHEIMIVCCLVMAAIVAGDRVVIAITMELADWLLHPDILYACNSITREFYNKKSWKRFVKYPRNTGRYLVPYDSIVFELLLMSS
jgi:hypothetical protein